MKTTSGKISNIQNSILGKIKLIGEKIILLIPQKNNVYSKIQIISNNNKITNSKKIIQVVDTSIFKSGDIIQVEPSGKITFLYECNSDSNLIFITNLCNCSCIMCPQYEQNKENFYERNEKLISMIDSKTEFLAFTGGEPTLIRDEFLALLNLCKSKLKKTKIEILTNGILLSDIEYVKEIMLINHPELSFHIPLYSDISSIHNEIVGSEGFYKTIKGFYNLAKFQQIIELRIVIHKQNFERLPQLAEFIYRNLPFVSHIALMGMEYQGNAMNNFDSLWIDPYDYNQILKETALILNQRFMNFSIFNHQLCVLDKSLWKFSRKSISSWKNINIKECNRCNQKDNCGGFFSTSKSHYSSHINPITELKVSK
ncbi:MAG: His-Xaa-Ser system radical SAM maturase HxsC [Candidatus Cloacimonadales bacterium]|nr:His-Xaa-Ser system radical SAM maturase HxsC [Candidatus Cloacimonadales bacterium]